MQLVRYEQARTALAECSKVDEVKDIRDKAEAMAAYARQAKDSELIQYATEIKVRAERRAGELLRRAADRGERATRQNHRGSMSNAATCPPALADIGITRDESSRWQKVAAIPEAHFETAIAVAKSSAGEVTTAFLLREASKHRPAAKPQTGKHAQALRRQLDDAARDICSCLRAAIAAIQQRHAFNPQERECLSELRRLINSIPL